jgi:hypothetical protein
LITFAGCARKEAAPTDTRLQVAMLDEHLSLGESVTVGNLTVWPVFTDQPLDIGEFLTLQEAIETRVAEVREVGGRGGQQTAQVIQVEEEIIEEPVEVEEEEPFEGPQTNAPIGNEPFSGPSPNSTIGLGNGGGATVGTLVIENKSDLPILICAGTVVKGGNQDRQIGQDIVVQAKSSVPVDAFCVEQGRWANERLGEVTDGKFVGASTNAMIGVRSKGQYELAQNAVWVEVSKVKSQVLRKTNDFPFALVSQSIAANSSLAVAQDGFEVLAREEIDAVCEEVRAHFARLGEKNAPVGYAYALNGKPVNVRSFAHARVFDKQFDPFLRAMATESLLAEEVEHEPAKASDVVALVKEIQKAEETKRETAAANWNGVRKNLRGFAANCYFVDEGDEVVITRDWTAK